MLQEVQCQVLTFMACSCSSKVTLNILHSWLGCRHSNNHWNCFMSTNILFLCQAGGAWCSSIMISPGPDTPGRSRWDCCSHRDHTGQTLWDHYGCCDSGQSCTSVARSPHSLTPDIARWKTWNWKIKIEPDKFCREYWSSHQLSSIKYYHYPSILQNQL